MKLRSLALVFSTAIVVEAGLIPQSSAGTKAGLIPRFRWPWTKRPVEGYPKYFHELGTWGAQNHYDSRYQHGVQKFEDKTDTQVHMLRAYLHFFKTKGIETWLAHGTLLGWWWNGKMLPWDWDIDFQISGPSLTYLAAHFNGSTYSYNSLETDPKLQPPIERQYLLDINPAITDRERGNGNNVIDARWIDIRNGLYIDVTAVVETEPAEMPGVWSCKDYHRYRTRDLYPMRLSVLEGSVAKVPYAYDRILAEEYQEKALVVTEYEGHRWRPELNEWAKKTPPEIAQEQIDREEALRRKLEEQAERLKKAKAKQEIKTGKSNGRNEATKFVGIIRLNLTHTNHGIAAPEEGPHSPKVPSLVGKNTESMPDTALQETDPYFPPEPEKETSGLTHLRRHESDEI